MHHHRLVYTIRAPELWPLRTVRIETHLLHWKMPSANNLPPMGFIAVQCHFTRPPGDPWNEQTWPFPLIRETAEGSRESQLITNEEYDEAFLNRFVEAGLKLAEQGCVGIITSCGFLAMAQPM